MVTSLLHQVDSAADTLTTWWWLILALTFGMYIALDGDDLGAGIYALFAKDEQERAAIMGSMNGIWDMAETWLVVSGGIIFGAFPLVYGATMNYLFIPLAFTLWGIIMRAVAFEYHPYAKAYKPFWGWSFSLGSLITIFFAGVALGATLHGFPMSSGLALSQLQATGYHTPIPHYSGQPFSFISPFAIWTGVGAVIAAGLAGGLYLCARFVPGDVIHERARVWTKWFYGLAIAAVVITLVWSYAIFPWAAQKWTGNFWWLWAIWLLIILALAAASFFSHVQRHYVWSLVYGEAMVALLWFAMWATMYPYIVPSTWTISEAADPENTIVVFTLFLTGFVPVMLMYNIYQLWVFRGKVTKQMRYE